MHTLEKREKKFMCLAFASPYIVHRFSIRIEYLTKK